MRTDRPGRLVLVHWRDTVSYAGWQDSWEPDLAPAECVDVGWLTRCDAEVVVLVRSLRDPECDNARDTGDATVIPRGWVSRVVDVTEP